MTTKTDEIIQALREDTSERITPCLYTWAFGRSHVSAAFRKAKALGVIEVAYISVAGTPVYRHPLEG